MHDGVNIESGQQPSNQPIELVSRDVNQQLGTLRQPDSSALAWHPAQPGAEVRLSQAQRAIVNQITGSRRAVLVVGGPGSGKTTTLLTAVAGQVGPGRPLSRFLVLTHSRSAAQQLRSALIARVGLTQRNPQVMTLHAWAQGLLRCAGGPGVVMPRLLTAPEQELRLRELLAGADSSTWPGSVRLALPTRGFASQMRALLARARQLGLDPADLCAIGQRHNRAELVAAGQFFAEYLDVLDAEGVLDYAELIHRARLALLDDQLAGTVSRELEAVYVDEFAELDGAQLALLADLHRLGIGVFGFADPHTSVFGFRGADERAVAGFQQLFEVRGEPGPVVVNLPGQLRGGTELAKANERVRAHLPNYGVPDRLGASRECGVGDGPGLEGSGKTEPVQAFVVDDDQACASHIANLLRSAHAEDGLGWDQMAVITGSGHAVAGLARRLSAAGVPVQVWGDQVALRDEVAVRVLLEVLEAAQALAGGQRLAPSAALRLLRSPIGGVGALAVRRLGRLLRARHQQQQLQAGCQPAQVEVRASADLLAAELSPAGALDGGGHLLDDDPGDLAANPEVQQLLDLRALLADLVKMLASGAEPTSLLWRAWSGTNWPQRLQAQALAGGEGAQRANRDLDSVIALFDVASRANELVGEKGLLVLLSQVEAEQIAADTARESDPRGRGVAVLTVHRAKGLEWPLVVVTGLQEGVWPRIRPPVDLLDASRLSRDELGEPASAASQITADRRAFLLAISRASQHLVVVATSGAGGEGAVSRFVTELGVAVRTSSDSLTGSLEDLVASLRRHASDTRCSSALRVAAARQLAQLARATDDAGRVLVPSANPKNWWGLDDYTTGCEPLVGADEPVRMTGSELESVLTCPRAWFLDRRARAEQPTGTATSLGTIIHALAQHCYTGELTAPEMLKAADKVWDQVPFEANWLAEAEHGEVEAALNRLAVWSARREHSQVLGVEVPFQVEVQVGAERVLLVGAVDRLEADDQGRLRIVDFKTGRSAPTAKQVAQMDQLGLYQLAARYGGFDHLEGGRRELADAELVYLRVPEAKGSGPKVFTQPSLDRQPKLAGCDPEAETWVHERLGKAIELIRSESFPAIRNPRCRSCAFAADCPVKGGMQW